MSEISSPHVTALTDSPLEGREAPFRLWAGVRGFKAIHWILLALGLTIGMGLFWWAAQRHSHQFNTIAEMPRHDQEAIMHFTRRIYKNPAYSGTRNKMPLYPYIQSRFMEENESDAELFEKGKTINIILTMTGLLGLAAVFLAAFPTHLAINLTLIASYTFLVFKAPYFQPDVLFYYLAFTAFLLMWRLFVRGGVFVAILCGVVIALAHYAKAAGLPMIMLFALFYGAAQIYNLLAPSVFRSGPPAGFPNRRPAWKGIVELVLIFGVFILILRPYLLESKQRFHSYFYNVNSSFYMWCDSWEDAKAFSAATDDRHGAPELPPDQLPGPRKYLKDHTFKQIVTRQWRGMGQVLSISLHSYGYATFLILYAAAIGFMIWKDRISLWPMIRAQPFLAAFLIVYFFGYYLLYSWYAQVGKGQRFIIGLLLPALFTLGWCYMRVAARSRVELTAQGRRMRFADAAQWFITFGILLNSAYILLYDIVNRNGGS